MSDLPAGPELDRLVDEKVMGRIVKHRERFRHGRANGMEWVSAHPDVVYAGDPFFPISPYSTDIAAAWPVAEKVGISVLKIPTGWAAGVWPEGEDNRGEYRSGECYDGDFKHYAEADTAPLAICYAALRAVEAQ